MCMSASNAVDWHNFMNSHTNHRPGNESPSLHPPSDFSMQCFTAKSLPTETGLAASLLATAQTAKYAAAAVAQQGGANGASVPNWTAAGAAAAVVGENSVSPGTNGHLLGHGARGHVYLVAASNADHNHVAASGSPFPPPPAGVLARKIVPVTLDDPVLMKNLQLELTVAHALYKAKSPHLLSVSRLHVRPAFFMIDMEYMDGGHAGRMVPVPEPVLAAMTRQLVAGLRVLHDELRVVHRDLKPENVLLNSAGRVKIADFGVAALLPPGVDAATDQQGTILQMSPERLRGEPHGFASDVWSLGVTVAQLATGRHPFVPAGAAAASTERFWLLAEVIRHTASAEECEAATRAAVDKALAAASPELRDFVHRCTAASPDSRATTNQLQDHPWLRVATDVLDFSAVKLPPPRYSDTVADITVVRCAEDWD